MRIEAGRLHVTLKGRHVLRGLDFVAHPGQLTAVIGPTGAKSTPLQRWPGAAGGGHHRPGNRPWPVGARRAHPGTRYLPQERTVH
jgi:iron complex transport system ATP-binding protein